MFCNKLCRTSREKIVNLASVSPFMSLGNQVNGVSINLVWNFYNRANGLSTRIINDVQHQHGLQIGILHRTSHLKGLQIGCWNRNQKRSLPLVNWNFAN